MWSFNFKKEYNLFKKNHVHHLPFVLIILVSLLLQDYSYAENYFRTLYEVRKSSKEDDRKIYLKPYLKKNSIYQLSPGDLIIDYVGKSEYVNKERMELSNLGLWQSIPVQSTHLEQKAYFYNTWKSYSYYQMQICPIELELKMQKEKFFFAYPDLTKARIEYDCYKNPQGCRIWIPMKSSFELLDTDLLVYRNEKSQLLYKVHYKNNYRPDEPKNEVGWVPAHLMQRKLGIELCDKIVKVSAMSELSDLSNEEELRKFMLANRTLSNEKKVIKSKSNKKTNFNTFSRWSKPVKDGKIGSVSSEEYFELDVNFELGVSIEHMSLNDVFLGDFSSSGLGFHIGGIAPLFLNFEIGGFLEYYIPLISEHKELVPNVVKFDQFLLYTLQSSSQLKPVKFGVGWNLVLLTQTEAKFSFNGAAGARAMLMVESLSSSSFVNWGPIVNSKTFDPKNYMFELGITFRVNPKQGFDSLMITSKASYLTFTNEQMEKLGIISGEIGIMKSF